MRVLICDRAWPDLDVEEEVFGAAEIEFVEAPSLDEPTLVSSARDASALMTCFAYVTAPVIEAAQHLRIVARFGTGVDMIDVEAARRRGAVVTNVPDYCTDEVAEHTLALILASLRGVVRFDRLVRGGGWRIDYSAPPQRVSGKMLGVIGFGKIGAAVTRRGVALGMDVKVHSRRGPLPEITEAGASFAELDEIAAGCDVVTLHVPADDATRGMIDEGFIRAMRPGSYLVNTSRGSLVDETALVAALKTGHLAGAALDVLSKEPPQDRELTTLDNVIVTPHVAFYSPESVALMRRLACEDVVRALKGEPPLRPLR